jgi:cysteinyl-tRNA synthetase
LLEGIKLITTIPSKTISSFSVSEWIQSCYDAMNDDFNTPILIANIFEGVRYINLLNDNSATLTSEDLQLFSTAICSFTFDVLGLKDEKSVENNNEKLEGVINMLISMRNEARANKDFAMSDQIRNQLIALGIQLKDGKEGTTFSVQ